MEEIQNPMEGMTLLFESEKDRLQSVPAAVLAKVVEAAQQIVYLLAHQEEGINLATTGRFQREIELNYTLLCSPFQPGSVIVPMHFAPGTNLFERQSEVTALFAAVGSAVAKNDERALTRSLPDPNLRRRVLNGIDEMVPPAYSGIRATLSGPSDLKFVLSDSTRRVARELRRLAVSVAQPAVNRMTITGNLTRINFAERRLTLQYPVTGRELDCVYSSEVEDDLLAERRGWIQVTGNVVLDAEGNPESVTDVEEVRPLDLSPIELRDFDDDEAGITLRFREPISVVPTQDESRQLLIFDYEPLDLHTHGMTREELEDSIYGLVWVLWDDYVKAPDDKFSARAREYKAKLLGAIEEAPLAA